jgi:UDP-2,3-diacylglucosamine hydrolase
MQLPTGKKIYFLSDFHLGAPDHASSLVREKRIVGFLSGIQEDAAAIFIVGDLFDFWYEYKKVVPKGFVRMLGKMAELTDSGIPLYFFVGNHDMWMSGYFEKELNIPVYYEPRDFEFNGKSFLIGHGDGLGPGDRGYKFLKKIFRNKACQWLFGLLQQGRNRRRGCPLFGRRRGMAYQLLQRSAAAETLRFFYFWAPASSH